MTTRRTRQQSKRSYERRISVRTIRRDPPDLHKLGRALLALAQADAEARAQAEHEGAAVTPGKEERDDVA
jgi:hypothetical protein